MTFIRIGDEAVVTEESWRAEHLAHGAAVRERHADGETCVEGLRCPCGAGLVTAIGSGLHPRAAAVEALKGGEEGALRANDDAEILRAVIAVLADFERELERDGITHRDGAGMAIPTGMLTLRLWDRLSAVILPRAAAAEGAP